MNLVSWLFYRTHIPNLNFAVISLMSSMVLITRCRSLETSSGSRCRTPGRCERITGSITKRSIVTVLTLWISIQHSVKIWKNNEFSFEDLLFLFEISVKFKHHRSDILAELVKKNNDLKLFVLLLRCGQSQKF